MSSGKDQISNMVEIDDDIENGSNLFHFSISSAIETTREWPCFSKNDSKPRTPISLECRRKCENVD